MTIENILAEARESIKTKGYLDLSHRMKIWKACGERCYFEEQNNLDEKIVTLPLKKRVRLGELCIKKVLPAWDAKTNKDPRPYYLMNLINSYLYGDTPKAALNEEARKCSNFAFELEHHGILGSHTFAMDAAATLANTALRDVWWFLFDYEGKDTHEYIDGEAVDVELTAAQAYAFVIKCWGYESSGEWDNKKRKEFWLWYIDEAEVVLNATELERTPEFIIPKITDKNIEAIVTEFRQWPKSTRFSDRDFSNLDLSMCFLPAMDFNDSSFKNSCLTGVMFDRSEVGDTSFYNANLENASFECCEICGTDFSYANLRGANFKEINHNLVELEEEDVEDEDFIPTRFCHADLTNAIFLGAIVRFTDFTGAILTGADFSQADTTGSIFTDCIGLSSNFTGKTKTEG